MQTRPQVAQLAVASEDQATSTSGGASVDEAFTPGKEGAARQQIFNNIARNYDTVSGMWHVATCLRCTGTPACMHLEILHQLSMHCHDALWLSRSMPMLAAKK